MQSIDCIRHYTKTDRNGMRVRFLFMKGGENMKFVVKPENKFELGFCNACGTDCKNDCGKQCVSKTKQ